MSTDAKSAPAKMQRLRPQRSTGRGQRARRDFVEALVQYLLLACGIFSIFVTAGIVAVLVVESSAFFRQVSVGEFLGGTTWKPQFDPPAFGVLPLVAGTLVTTTVALAVAIPLGTISAVYLSEFAPAPVREGVKPVLELLSAVPTVVYGYFAALTIAPLVRDFAASLGMQNPSTESALAAGLVMGVMIIPFVSSMADDSIAAVPRAMSDGSLAMGATKSETIKKVLLPAALPGIVAGVMLAISRAIGETMIVVMAAGAAANLTANPFESMTTVTFQIVAMLTGEGSFDHPATLSAFALGMVLFLVTLTLNFIALRVVKRYREAYD